jgi:tripeptidyl-peptidase I
VTAVGGTQLAANSSVSSPGGEVVANQSAPGLSNYSPGSGFSNYYAVPAYQKAAVDGYFKQHPSPYPSYHYNGSNSSIGANGGLYNAGGRAYPDVSTLSANIYTVASGCWGLDGGTSYASPIFAGIISRLNSERLEAGKSTLGFLNPILYSHPEVLNDITTGHNYGCGTEGFPAAMG